MTWISAKRPRVMARRGMGTSSSGCSATGGKDDSELAISLRCSPSLFLGGRASFGASACTGAMKRYPRRASVST